MDESTTPKQDAALAQRFNIASGAIILAAPLLLFLAVMLADWSDMVEALPRSVDLCIIAASVLGLVTLIADYKTFRKLAAKHGEAWTTLGTRKRVAVEGRVGRFESPSCCCVCLRSYSPERYRASHVFGNRTYEASLPICARCLQLAQVGEIWNVSTGAALVLASAYYWLVTRFLLPMEPLSIAMAIWVPSVLSALVLVGLLVPSRRPVVMQGATLELVSSEYADRLVGANAHLKRLPRDDRFYPIPFAAGVVLMLVAVIWIVIMSGVPHPTYEQLTSDPELASSLRWAVYRKVGTLPYVSMPMLVVGLLLCAWSAPRTRAFLRRA